MRSSWTMLAGMLLVACGGGGGGASAPPIATAASLQIAPATIGVGQGATELTVALTAVASAQPALLQVEVALPPELSFASSDRLTAATALATLDGNFTGNRFHILCGDANNQSAQPLPNGALFRLRLQPSTPRTPGTYTVTFRNLAAATSQGDSVPLAAKTLAVSVTIQ